MPVSELRAVDEPVVRRVSLATAKVDRHGDVRVNVVVEGRIEAVVMKAAVAAMLASEIVTALGSTALYNAGLERAAQVLDAAALERAGMSDPREELAAAAVEIRECKVGRSR